MIIQKLENVIDLFHLNLPVSSHFFFCVLLPKAFCFYVNYVLILVRSFNTCGAGVIMIKLKLQLVTDFLLQVEMQLFRLATLIYYHWD